MATAAEPILASALWPSDLDVSEETPSERPLKKRRLATSHASIDKALDGGLDTGSISCISCELNSGADELSLSLLITHLLDSPAAGAVYIDSAQSLDVRRLHHLIVSRLEGRGDNADAAAQTALQTLDRIRIMRVFDFVGLTESISEVRDLLEGRQSEGKEPIEEEREAILQRQQQQQHYPPPRGTIADSQMDADEDEMLDEPSQVQTTSDKAPVSSPPSLPPAEPPTNASSEEALVKPTLLIINNLPTLVAPLIKANLARGTSLLLTFLRSLGHLTRSHDLYTLILNPGSTHFSKDESPSIFQSCTLRPILGRSFERMVDLHLLVHALPRSKEDARELYGTGKGQERRGLRAVEKVMIVEVWKDGMSGRVGRWAAFVVDEIAKIREIEAR